ncbi:MAG: response regulator [Pirellulaceae bacterium]|jgi:hypothetical protein|nr:response regulator [Planctomycetaceae bacterium]HIM30776.1 response regulator [Planctomycetota bacterium]
MSHATYFHLDCPTCGRPLQIQIKLLGKPVKCRHCRASFTATGDEDLCSAEPDLDQVEELLRQADQFLAKDEASSIGSI